MRRAVILANGEWGARDAHREQLFRLVETADHVIAADGAFDCAIEWGISVDTLIGDLDSVKEPTDLQLRYPGLQVIRHSPEKDLTDLELAMEWALDQSPESLVLFGATGKRVDHTMTNLAMLERGLHAGVTMELVAGWETVRLVQNELVLDDARPGDRVSLLPVSLFVTVTTSGLRFALSGEKLFRGWGRGISNVVDDMPVRVQVETGVLAVVHSFEGAGGADREAAI